MKERTAFASILLFAQLTVSVTVGLITNNEILLRLGLALSLLLPLLLLVRAPADTRPPRFLARGRHATAVLLLLPLFILLTAGVSIGTGAIFRLFGLPVSGATPMDMLVAAILLDALLPAVSEELFCRGMLYGVLRPMGRRTAVLGSAVLFALMHAGAAQLPYALLAGILLALLYELTGSLLYPILFHFGNNLFSLLLLFGAPPLPLFLVLGASSALGLLLFFPIARRARLSLPHAEPDSPTAMREFLLSPLSAYIIVMLVLSVL